MQLVHMPPDASEDEVAAALEVQRMPATRNGAFSTWGSVERSRRAARWSKGLVGL
jgi:hypothetical protein